MTKTVLVGMVHWKHFVRSALKWDCLIGVVVLVLLYAYYCHVDVELDDLVVLSFRIDEDLRSEG